MRKILVVDDNPAIGAALVLLFELEGMGVIVARSPEEALDVLGREDIAVVLQDMNFTRDTTSGEEGVALMRAIKRIDQQIPILLMTAFTSLETAVRLVKEGASDYIAKPWKNEKLVATVRNLVELRRLSDENGRMSTARTRVRTELASKFDLRGIVYESAEMHEVASLASRVANADVPILILGPNGSGKEKLAEIVQANSRRKAKPFIKVNAGALPEQLLEAELFGAEAGAFTGAARTRIGRFEEAHGGTLFLDEIGNLSMAGQMKLLRVLQTGEFQRIGSNVSRKADVRVIAATNVDIPHAIRQGTFREDLYFRLNVIELRVPALRDRVDDILVLADHFFAARRADTKATHGFSAAAREALTMHDWPGNVRELENRVQRAVLIAQGSEISVEDLGLTVTTSRTNDTPEASDDRAELERVLRESDGVVTVAAALLGVSRQAFYRRMQRAGLHLERRVKPDGTPR
ncbi:Histidine kinase/response regulator hybrid protein [Labilithrix luteola]|uniref:Histidine kinase/response regulator hybrid protein n=1 Tax=Labilithrix luteola TaxID=1391654 RepID=A0A0K1PND9_9BACT|nr:sigma-54 dependent transcriptional regulator [Labilithrix luteola]AKU95043.1 Histidine kinase/response regulator hybrid protein [Labilithrix luteola]